MKFIILLIAFLFMNFGVTKSQCFNLLSTKLDNIEKLPYSLIDKRVYDIKSGNIYSVKLSNISYKTKLAFLVQSFGVKDSVDVTLTTLNRRVLAKKLLTNEDCILRYEPFKKTENYFLLIKIPYSQEKKIGCIGILILERVTKKPFTKIQKIEWKFESTQ